MATQDEIAEQVTFSRLTAAVARIVDDYRAETDPHATVEDALTSTRAELDGDDIDVLVDDGALSQSLALAYREVLDAPAEALTPAVTSHADGILEGVFGNPYWEPGEDQDVDAACATASAAAATSTQFDTWSAETYDGEEQQREAAELDALG